MVVSLWHTHTHKHKCKKSIHTGRKKNIRIANEQMTICVTHSVAQGARVNCFFGWSPTQYRTQAEELNTCFIPDEETATAERLQVRVQQEVD